MINIPRIGGVLVSNTDIIKVPLRPLPSGSMRGSCVRNHFSKQSHVNQVAVLFPSLSIQSKP